MLIKFIIFTILCLLWINPLYAAHKNLEKVYQNYWCAKNHGVTEYKLADNTRVDCLTKDYAVEFDFASKVYESIGQALYYGAMTNKKPAVVLIIENSQKETRYLKRLKTVAPCYGITYWIITPSDLEFSP